MIKSFIFYHSTIGGFFSMSDFTGLVQFSYMKTEDYFVHLTGNFEKSFTQNNEKVTVFQKI